MATQATQLIETNSPQLEASLEGTANPTQDFGTRIRSITYDAHSFENAEDLRAAFEEAEKGAHEAAKTKFKAEGDLILYVAKIQSYLSERGANAHLRKAAGIPAGFERWYTNFRAQYDVEYAFKTVQHKIAQLHGGCEHCGRLAQNDADHKKSCILYRPLIELAELGENRDRPELDMKQLTTAHYADRYMAMVGLLTNAPKDATPQEIIATMQQEAQSAYEELDSETAQKIRVPSLVKLPDPDYTNLKNGIEALKAENDSHEEDNSGDQSTGESLQESAGTTTVSGVGPTPAAVTYVDWESHRLPTPDFTLTYFAEASGNFTDRYRCALQGSAITKVLTMLRGNHGGCHIEPRPFEAGRSFIIC